MREIGKACRKVKSNVQFHLDHLERDGLITREHSKARGIRIPGMVIGLVVDRQDGYMWVRIMQGGRLFQGRLSEMHPGAGEKHE